MNCPRCLGRAEFQGHRPRDFLSLLGSIRPAERPYSHCPACHAGHCPGDVALGIERAGQTPAAQQVITLAGTVESFGGARKLLPKLTGLRPSESTVERTTERTGARLGDRLNRGDTFGSRTPWPWHTDATGRTRAYLSIDATGGGQQGPGGGKAEGRMAYVGMVFNPLPEEPAPSQGSRRPHPAAVSQSRYLAGLHDLEGLGTQLHRHAHHVGVNAADRLIALTDGGRGLEEIIRQYFPDAVFILDFWHAAGHLCDLAKALCGADAEAGRALGQTWCHELKHCGGAAVLTTVQGLDLSGHPATTCEVQGQVTQYLENNLHRRDYPHYRRQGWQIGSGSVESACKTVINQRLNGTGMRWGAAGTDSVSHRRALFLSEESQWDAFWAPSRN
jgi:hypothetical protein